MSDPRVIDPLIDPLVQIQNVTKCFNASQNGSTIYALKNVTASIPSGKLVGLVGPDGSGKTTLIRLIAGLLVPTEGSIKVQGFDTRTENNEISNLIGYMPQKFGLYEDLTVLQNLTLYADIQGVFGEERKQAFERLLNFTRLQPFISRLAGALSGGMKQKLGLACTLIRKPVLLLLDEPSVGVDPLSRRELWSMIQDLIVQNITVVWSTAYLDEAERCQSILLLSEGKVLFSGDAHLLTDRVKNRAFKLTHFNESKRDLLEQSLLDPCVVDGTIQGKDIRVVLKNQSDSEILKNNLKDDALQIIPTQARFEDAFIDIIGGVPKEPSVLSNKFAKSDVQEVLVEAHGLTKQFGSFTAADNITFQIQSGEIFGLLGPNGAGKSTTFKMLCGLLKPTHGKAIVNGLDLLKAPGQARSHIGYMAQKFSLYGNLSVWQNLQFFSGVYNLNGDIRREAVHQMVEAFHLKEYLNQSADSLPLGFKQRLALSCAIMHRPKVLFLDEPTSGVDPLTRREFWSHIYALVQSGMTIMVTTHFMDEAEYCDRIALIYQGKMISLGTPDELKDSVRSNDIPDPTLDDAFVMRIRQYDESQKAQNRVEVALR